MVLNALVYDPAREDEFQVVDQYIYESDRVRVNIQGRVFFWFGESWFTVGAMFYELQAKHKLPREVLEEINIAIATVENNNQE